MSHLLILDSGAYSVWTKGKEVDLDAYIAFCDLYSDVDYYVNLDVIPGKPGDRSSLGDRIAKERACKQGWDNYQHMIKFLPRAKVLPVFHENDSFKWLERYLNDGVTYIGISPANDSDRRRRARWMKECSQYVLDPMGEPVVKMHGFGVTSYPLMKYWHWHSVDSASWVRSAAYGSIYVPRRSKGIADFNQPPLVIAVTPQSPRTKKRDQHLATCSPLVKAMIMEWLEELGERLGTYRLYNADDAHKLRPDELWFSKKHRQCMRITQKGVATNLQRRYWINTQFLERANEVLPIDHIYRAGCDVAVHKYVERRLPYRLFSYESIRKSKQGMERLQIHLREKAHASE